MHKFELCYQRIKIRLVGHRLFKCLVDLHAKKELSVELSMLFLVFLSKSLNCMNKQLKWTTTINLIKAKSSQEYFHTTLCLKKKCKRRLKLRLMQKKWNSKLLRLLEVSWRHFSNIFLHQFLRIFSMDKGIQLKVRSKKSKMAV